MVTNHLSTPSSPHVVISTNGLAVSHEPKIHSRPNEFPMEPKVHPTHREKCLFRYGHHSIHIPGVALTRLDKLSRGIIVRDVEPKAMRDGSGGTFS